MAAESDPRGDVAASTAAPPDEVAVAGTVRAAGCVLWRYATADPLTGNPGGDGSPPGGITPAAGGGAGPPRVGGTPGSPAIEVALVHRPRYDDWSHPKGKLHAGESAAAAAVREVLEETGMECVLGARLPTARYLADGRMKEVSYWVAEAVGGVFVPNDEVDVVVWLPPDHARAQLSSAPDRPLLDAAVEAWRRPARASKRRLA